MLIDLATMLVDGGECVSDLGALADQPDLFGRVASHSIPSMFHSSERDCCERN